MWGPDDLFSQALGVLLKDEKNYKVIKVPATQCVRELVKAARRIEPDLLIFYQNTCADESHPLRKLLEQEPEIQALADLPELKMIFISPENNVLQLYSKRSVTVRSVTDLLAIIEDQHCSVHPDEKEVPTD